MTAAASRPAARPAAASQRAPSAAGLRRRRWRITWTKRLLPVAALALLACVAMWPELQRDTDQERLTVRQLTSVAAGGADLTAPHYRSVDVRGRPYTVTATTGRQDGPERVDLAGPKGDVTLENGLWLLVQSRQGVFMQHSGLLDLSGDATLYRADGTTMVSDAATVNVKAGVASSSDLTHAEGPFGTLDAAGFTLLDRGAVVQFPGPAHARLNGGETVAHVPAPPPARLPAAPPPPPVLARR